ncbi:hypothetical protein F0P96_11710 [Hymenobacter busanensis]|uniref:Uncharacterized protein n=1 Tax=Hymenobacter busanensis TaxID=2607656 RepID=A0A7L4ZX70_9BACT|nr:hypothetical protein [Hymenobacter busanensis]KAA9332148.1 hypothetical protein F0P96_11710 [Hymenobacter busanensis]QHJ07513.1 hypothetical protein GUY19_09560 [Hymenobacter busanensis]
MSFPLLRFLRVLCCCWLILLGSVGAAVAQQPTAPPQQTVPDSLRNVPLDSLRRRFDQQRFLNNLKAYTKRKTIVGKALSAAFNFTERREEQAGLDAALLDRQYDRHTYKIVRRVQIVTLDAFGYSITDTTRVPRNVLEKGGNFFHLTTARRKVRKLLLFKPGQELEPQALAETERLLRQTDFILDARVVVDERTTTQDSVDIRVITKDVFSLSGGFQLRDVGSGVVTLRDKNFVARGHDFRNRFAYGLSNPKGWAYQGSYTVPLRNYLVGQARYRNEWQFEERAASLSRGFVSVNTQYAYSAGLTQFRQGYLTTPVGQTPEVFLPIGFNVADGWLGRSFRPRSYDLGFDNPARIIVATRLIRTDYTQRPNRQQFGNSTLALLSLGYSVRHYYKDRYLFGFGRTEDVPTGTLLTLTGGYDLNENGHRPYVGTRIAAAGFSPLRGYLYMSGEISRFLQNGRWQQGVFSGEALAFTRLYHMGDWQLRHFFWTRALIGIQRTPGDLPLSIEGERGLRGFSPDSYLRGSSRFVVNYETNMFTPVSFLGFRLAGIAFADAAWLSTNGRESPFQQKPYTGFGVGLRFRNEYLAVSTIQILLGYYPRGITDGSGLRVFESSRSYYQFNDFSFGQPGITRYD